MRPKKTERIPLNKGFHAEFKRCPVCGSRDRFFERLGEELKESGRARPEWSFHLDVRSGPVVDKQKMEAFSLGVAFPGYGIITDVCMNCGTIYAKDLTRLEAHQQIPDALKNEIIRGGK